MDRHEAIKELKAQQDNPDTEDAHDCADRILVWLLDDLGYDDVTEEWEKVGKWYA
jgi:hypothetical protein